MSNSWTAEQLNPKFIIKNKMYLVSFKCFRVHVKNSKIRLDNIPPSGNIKAEIKTYTATKEYRPVQALGCVTV